MSRKKEIRARPEDVVRRFAARMWLTDAISRAQRDGIDHTPVMPLLEALEDLDDIEVIEDYLKEGERVLFSSRAGPAGTLIRPREKKKDGTVIEGQVARLIGKVDRILAMPEPSETIISGDPGGRKRTPAEAFRIAFACAAIEILRRLGKDRSFAIGYVEDSFGRMESDYKRIQSGREAPDLIKDYETELSRMGALSLDDVFLEIVLMEGK